MAKEPIMREVRGEEKTIVEGWEDFSGVSGRRA